MELISNPANFARSAIFQINKELGNNLTDISISGDYSSDFNETTWNNNWSVNQGYKPTYQELMTKITLYTDALTLTDNIIEFEEGPIEGSFGNTITYQLSDVNLLPTIYIIILISYLAMEIMYKRSGVITIKLEFH